MKSVEEYEAEFGQWIDARVQNAVKTAIAEANTDLTAYLDQRFGGLEHDLNNVGGVVDSMAKDVGAVVDSLAQLGTSLLAIPQSIVDKIGTFNPFHLP